MSKKNILIVDDEDVIREFLVEVLSEHYDTSTATDGDEAINLIKVNSFDLVITDLKMERVQGEEVVQFSHDHCPDTKIIVISGYASLFSSSQCVSYGACAYLSKPFNMEKLLSTVDEALAS